jgi:hypothetical protein
VKPILLALFFSAFSAPARAEVIQAPVGGRPVPLSGSVICGDVEGWTVADDGRSAQPRADAKIGRGVEARLAPDIDGCVKPTGSMTFVATAPWPEIDPATVTLAADEGWVEIKGERLQGLQLFWQAGGSSGDDLCLEPSMVGKTQRCQLAVGRGLPANGTVTLSWLPAGGRRGPDVVTFDAAGRRVAPKGLELRPARTLISNLLPPKGVVDITSGVGRVPIGHPEAVSSVDCGTSRCEIVDDAVVIRSVPGLVNGISIGVRLVPRVFVARGDALETRQTATVSVLHCPISLASGPPLRDVEDARVVISVDARCARDAKAFRWLLNGNPAEVLQVDKENDSTFVLLQAGRLKDDRFNLLAMRPEPEPLVIAAISGKTLAPPPVRAALELAGYGKIDFIPTNREAVLRTLPVDGSGKLVPIGVRGAYDVRSEKGATLIRGDENAAGFVALRFGYRVETVPAIFQSTDLAVITEPLQRTIREASVPVPIGTSALSGEPLIEMQCAGGDGQIKQITPGITAKIPFAQRDSCRVIIHRERLRPEEGGQDVNLDITVANIDGAARSEGRISERMILRPAKDPRIFWIRGVQTQFDRITVRVAQVIDEGRYMGGGEPRNNAPSVQWAVVVGEAHLRLYATASIPTGLYRLNDPRGILSLNFGVLSRLTRLDESGHESLFGLELGVMGVSLIGTTSDNIAFPPTLATLIGAGISIPLGNRGEVSQATVNLHAWMAYEFRGNLSCAPGTSGTPESPCPPRDRSRLAFYFGPSISIGNVGTNL